MCLLHLHWRPFVVRNQSEAFDSADDGPHVCVDSPWLDYMLLKQLGHAFVGFGGEISNSASAALAASNMA